MLEDHETLTIEAYRKQAGKLETRMCREHKETAYSVGCSVCLAVLCSSCISSTNLCKQGKVYGIVKDLLL